MTAPVRTPELMTASRLKALGTCPRLHQNRYLRRRVPRREAPALRNGTAVHAALEAWWRAFGRGASGDEALDDALTALTATLAELDPFDAVRVEAMVRGYHLAWWAWAVEHVAEVIGVELPFAYPMAHPLRGGAVEGWTVAGKMDLLLRLRDGRIAIGEHKSSGEDTRAGSDYQRKLTLDGQVSQYFEGAAFLGYPAEVCIYDILQKPTLRPALATPADQRRYTQPRSRACKLCGKRSAPPAPHTDPEAGVECVDGRVVTDPGGALYAGMRDADETIEEYAARLAPAIAADLPAYFRHVEVVRFGAQLTEHRVDLWHATRLLALLSHDLGPDALHPKNPSACFRYGRCAYLEVCEGVASLDDDALFRTLGTAHPELADAADTGTADTGDGR
jgi:hypothetical protein